FPHGPERPRRRRAPPKYRTFPTSQRLNVPLLSHSRQDAAGRVPFLSPIRRQLPSSPTFPLRAGTRPLPTRRPRSTTVFPLLAQLGDRRPHLVRVPLRLHLRPHSRDLAIRVDQVRHAQHAHVLL